MKNFGIKIQNYRKENNLTLESCAERLEITIEELTKIENEEIDLTRKEQREILDKLGIKYNKIKVSKALDLFFRLGTAIMGLVALLLCINGNVSERPIIVVLSIAVVCSSMITLPKIDK